MSGGPGAYALPGLWAPGDERSVARWESSRRPLLLGAFASAVYGRTPDGGGLDGLVVRARTEGVLGGTAVRIEADLTVAGPRGARTLSLLLHAPAAAGQGHPVPAFLGLNFQGNHATTDDPGVRIAGDAERIAGLSRPALPARGAERRRWPYAEILARGYAVATIWYEELEVDLPGLSAAGVRGLFDADAGRDPEGWGAIGAWAWGLSRGLDALSELPEIDASAVVAVGHSRLGKTALWAAAQDARFAGVAGNDSGCGGAALFRHRSGEDIALLSSVRPHWFAPGFARFRHAEEDLPVDQHHLLALQAPRIAHVGSASADAGADPRGELLSTFHASPIFDLYGLEGTFPRDGAPGEDLSATRAVRAPAPAVGEAIGGRLSYHLRDGEHDMLAEDWRHILDAADRGLGRGSGPAPR